MMRMLLLILLLAGPARAAEPMLVGAGDGAAHEIDPAALAALPQRNATTPGGMPHALSGPLLWDVLVREKLVDPAKHGEVPRQTLRLIGSDGYVAVVALGELSPEFEGKPAVLALTMDGTALDRPRAFLPGDRRGGRGVHDVARMVVDELPRGK